MPGDGKHWQSIDSPAQPEKNKLPSSWVFKHFHPYVSTLGFSFSLSPNSLRSLFVTGMEKSRLVRVFLTAWGLQQADIYATRLVRQRGVGCYYYKPRRNEGVSAYLSM